jgi:hypothetical protein
MDAHSVLLAEYVRKTILSQGDTIIKTDPNYLNIKQAINILWKKYFIFAFNGEELISSVVSRLRLDLDNNIEESKYISEYIDKFGKKCIML